MHACVSASAVVTLKWNASSNDLAVTSVIAAGGEPPALFTTMSILPSSSIAALANSPRKSSLLTSPGRTKARRPKPRMAVAISSSWSALRAVMATSAPASARARADAAPMPRPAPVTIATLLSTRKRSRRLMGDDFRAPTGSASDDDRTQCQFRECSCIDRDAEAGSGRNSDGSAAAWTGNGERRTNVLGEEA